MAIKITFSILGKPKYLQRHRHTNRGGYVHTYDPSAKDKKDFLLQAMQYKPKTPILSAVKLSVWFLMPRPKSHYRTGKFVGILKDSAPSLHTIAPDTTNLVKFIEDSLNKVFWKDDCQIYAVIAQKLYDERPRTVIQIDFK